jgi:hypothetical protein
LSAASVCTTFGNCGESGVSNRNELSTTDTTPAVEVSLSSFDAFAG